MVSEVAQLVAGPVLVPVLCALGVVVFFLLAVAAVVLDGA